MTSRIVTLTAERLREVFHYDPLSGIFTSKIRRGHIPPLTIASYVGINGYVEFRCDGRLYYAHRLAWLYMTGEWPAGQIDHRNGVRNDNAFGNLREADQSINSQNQRRSRINTKTGMLGVTMRATRNQDRFIAQIGHQGRRIYIGIFDTPENAHQAYVETKRRLHEGCTI